MIADRINLLRTRMGYTQTELAKKLDITRSSVNAWEMGISVPSTVYIVELANIFKVSADYILGIESSDMLNIASLTDEEKSIVCSLIKYFGNKE